MFQIPYIIDTFPNHFEIKNKTLDLINDELSSKILSGAEKISNSDWWNKSSKNKKYAKFLSPLIEKIVLSKLIMLNYSKVTIGSIWFQQYKKSDFHSWHRHPHSDWNFVYYLEFSESCPPTEFRNPQNMNDTFLPKIKEGEFVLFPSLLEHRSNVNLSEHLKTVVVANLKSY